MGMGKIAPNFCGLLRLYENKHDFIFEVHSPSYIFSLFFRAYKKIKSSKTWDHDKHDSKKSESCDVCNGRLTKEELADARYVFITCFHEFSFCNCFFDCFVGLKNCLCNKNKRYISIFGILLPKLF